MSTARGARFLIAVGAIATLGPLAGFIYFRSAQAREVRGVAPLHAMLDSLRAELRLATTSQDSALLAPIIRAREEGIGQRQYHIAHGQAHLDGWWEFPGLFTITTAAGLVCFVVGLQVHRRGRLDRARVTGA